MQLDDEYARQYMLPGERLLYGEKVASRGVFKTMLVMCSIFAFLGIGAMAIGLAAGPGAMGITVGGGMFLLTALLLGPMGVLFSVFRSMVTSSHLQVHFGWAKRKVPFDAIEQVKIIALQGIHQGKVKIGLDGVVRTWVGTPDSGRAVEVTYQDGKRKHVLTIGSEDPERFAQVLQQARAAAGTDPEAPAARVRVGAGVAQELEDAGEAAIDEHASVDERPRAAR